MRRRSLIVWSLCFSIALITASCTPRTTTPGAEATGSATPSTIVRMGFSAWPGWFPWQVSQEAGLFTKHNVTADLKWFDGYLDSINALVAGQLDANSQTLNDTISPMASGADLVVVLTNDNSTGNDQIIVREGINSIADLKGKKIAVEEGTVDHFLLLLGLQKEGLTAKDIQLQPLETGQAAAAFAAGKVDAVGAFAPFTTQALKLKNSKVLFSSKDFPGAISDHLVFDRKFVEAHPEQVQAMVDTWFDTLAYIQQNKAAAYAIMAKRAGVSVEEYNSYDAGTTIFSLEDNLKALELRDGDFTSLPFAAKEISAFLVESGLVKQAPDISKLFDDRFIKAYASRHGKS
jgi:NitT/TauT family transport system substrate-binding protein